MNPRRRVITPELAALLLVAFAVRLMVFELVPNVHWPDEIYQAMEPAHRLVFGTGAVAWEWVVGARSWFLPGLVAGLMELGRLFGDNPGTVNFPVAIAMAAAGCAPVACAYGWGRRIFGRAGGFAAASVSAVWVDLIYMSGHTLAEVAAADCLVVALYLGLPGADALVSRRRLWIAGALLGLTFALRFHLGPALVVAALGMCGWRGGLARWRAVVAGAAIPVLALGLLDWLTLGAPFQSIALNFWFNVEQSGDYAGRSPFGTLIVLPFYLWGGAGAVIFLTVLIGARRLPALLLTAIAVFATYSLAAHKEYRFIYPALILLPVLAGIGTAELLRLLGEARPNAFSSARIPAILAAIFWITTSSAIALSPVYLGSWTRERGQILAFDYLNRQPDVCGIGLYGVRWIVTPGYSGLRLGASLHQTDRPALDREAPGFNYILARALAPVPDSQYRRLACFAGDEVTSDRWLVHVCVWRREGACVPGAAPPLPVNWPETLFGKAEPDVAPGWKDPDDR